MTKPKEQPMFQLESIKINDKMYVSVPSLIRFLISEAKDSDDVQGKTLIVLAQKFVDADEGAFKKDEDKK